MPLVHQGRKGKYTTCTPRCKKERFPLATSGSTIGNFTPHVLQVVWRKEHYASCAPRCMKEGKICHLCSKESEGRVDTPLVLQDIRICLCGASDLWLHNWMQDSLMQLQAEPMHSILSVPNVKWLLLEYVDLKHWRQKCDCSVNFLVNKINEKD